MNIIDQIERVLFGASAAETVELRLKLAEQRVMQRIVDALEASDDEDEGVSSSADDTPSNGISRSTGVGMLERQRAIRTRLRRLEVGHILTVYDVQAIHDLLDMTAERLPAQCDECGLTIAPGDECITWYQDDGQGNHLAVSYEHTACYEANLR